MPGDHATKLILLRHGQTDWNAEQRFQGQADIPLNAQGIAQAEIARDALTNFDFDAVYASPLSRAVETARIIRPTAQLITDPRLMEINVGSWESRTWKEICAEFPEVAASYAAGTDYRRSPTGETMADVASRVVPVAEEIVVQHPGQKVLIVAHGMLLTCLIQALLGIEKRVLGGFGNAHFSELAFEHGFWRLLAHNLKRR